MLIFLIRLIISNIVFRICEVGKLIYWTLGLNAYSISLIRESVRCFAGVGGWKFLYRRCLSRIWQNFVFRNNVFHVAKSHFSGLSFRLLSVNLSNTRLILTSWSDSDFACTISTRNTKRDPVRTLITSLDGSMCCIQSIGYALIFPVPFFCAKRYFFRFSSISTWWYPLCLQKNILNDPTAPRFR